MPAMSQPRPEPRYTVDEYLAFERASVERHEYVDGQVLALAGESLAHGDICTNLVGDLRAQLRGTPCRVLSKDMKILSGPARRRSRQGLFSYPDVIVVCGEPRFHDEHRDVLLNPTVIVEVTSPSTEAFDRGEKWLRYQSWLPSLAEYVLVSQASPVVEHFARDPGGGWRYEAVQGLAARVALASIGATLRLGEIYDRVAFAPETIEGGAEDDGRPEEP